MKVLCGLLLLVSCAYSYHINNDYIEDEGWHFWKTINNKKYADLGAERVRYVIWQDNLKKIEAHNLLGKKYTLRINQFGDLTSTEFRTFGNGMSKTDHNRTSGSTFLAPSNTKIPTTVDWRTKGYVTPVKNQGQCGSCWAFSTTGSLEGQMFKKTGKLISLSEQQLVDCSKSFGNYGCEGGLMDNAFRYIKANPGIDTEESYPYEAEDLACRFKKEDVSGEDTGFVDIPAGDEEALTLAIATQGPISVAIDASHFSFQFYHKGVYDEVRCSTEQLDHGVLAVGYGVFKDSTTTGTDYYLVKNSWGDSWGLKGYIMMSRNKDNQCGIATSASYPLV